jgi:hypothetical protein
MSAGRSASSLLFTLIATIILFGLFVGVSSLKALEKHAYMPGFGWQQPADNAAGLHGVCEPTTATTGFPLVTTRQADAPDNCLKARNPLAHAMNFALYFAIAGIISVGVVESMRSRLP